MYIQCGKYRDVEFQHGYSYAHLAVVTISKTGKDTMAPIVVIENQFSSFCSLLGYGTLFNDNTKGMGYKQTNMRKKTCR